MSQGCNAAARSYLTVGLLSTLCFVIVSTLVFSNLTQSADAQLALSINQASLGAALTAVMVISTEYGREYFWIPVVGLMLVFGSRRTKLLAIELAALFVVGIALGEIMKFAVYRPRPFENIGAIVTRVPTDLDSSYPSGHALIVSIGAAFSVLKFKNKLIVVVLVLDAAIVCYSRIYVGMHYPLDVVAGILLAVGIVGIGLFVLEKYLGTSLSKVAGFATSMLKDGPVNL